MTPHSSEPPRHKFYHLLPSSNLTSYLLIILGARLDKLFLFCECWYRKKFCIRAQNVLYVFYLLPWRSWSANSIIHFFSELTPYEFGLPSWTRVCFKISVPREVSPHLCARSVFAVLYWLFSFSRFGRYQLPEIKLPGVQKKYLSVTFAPIPALKSMCFPTVMLFSGYLMDRGSTFTGQPPFWTVSATAQGPRIFWVDFYFVSGRFYFENVILLCSDYIVIMVADSGEITKLARSLL